MLLLHQTVSTLKALLIFFVNLTVSLAGGVKRKLSTITSNCQYTESSIDPVSELNNGDLPLVLDRPIANNSYQQGSIQFESGVAVTASCDLAYNKNLPIIHGTMMNLVQAPTIYKCFKLTLEEAAKWQNIGVLLKVPDCELKCIEKDYKMCKECLREMLREWLKQSNPTWTQLAEAVKEFNPKLAEKIRAQQQ